MDAKRFDRLTRSLLSATPRRSILRVVLGGVAVAPASATISAKQSSTCRPACDECNDCAKGKCRRKNGRKRCKQGTCQPRPDGTACAFPSGGATCQSGTCTCRGGLTICNGACVDTRSDKSNCGACSTACTVNQVCQNGICFPKGVCSPSTTLGLCTPALTPCSAPENACYCGRSTADNVVCVTDMGVSCVGPACAASPTCPRCFSDADCPTNAACIDATGCGSGCLPGTRVCLARCPAPLPA